MKKVSRRIVLSVGLLAMFVVWTVAVQCVDVQAIGPMGSTVGFATINRWVHNLTGVHLGLYILTDWLGLVPVAVCFGFGVLGLVQWIRRKHLKNVDFSILVLGGFYLLTMVCYLLFESVVINYRPILIEGQLEVSYPSSTTLLVLCVMPTAMLQLMERITHIAISKCVSYVICCFMTFMVIARLVSGVHWLSDIVGGALLSAGLVTMYSGICSMRK